MTLARQDLDCQADVVDPVYEPKLRDAKAEFVKQHAALLNELRAAMMER